ncbi:NDUV3 dehydrogenase, partial [Neodrepanis coruscans]|nr:NDUV3 dehydrogenase [Neodrepanis coruscans]
TLMSRKTVVAFPQRVSSLEEENLSRAAAGGGLRKELAEEETSSSSSSESDSSSDSEEESDDSGVAVKTKVEFPRREPFTFSENIAVKASQVAKESLLQRPPKEHRLKKLLRKPEIDVSLVKQVKFPKASVSQGAPKPKAKDSKVKSTPKAVDQQKLVSELQGVERQHPRDVTRKSDCLEVKSIGTQVAATHLKAATREGTTQKLVSRGEREKVEKAQESELTAAKVEETPGSTELVMGTTAKEETIEEAGVQAGESSTTEALGEPAPEELDNSTYQNLQHHQYHTYTFADYVAILSKFRQPQPSSGRPSPRH